MRKKVYVLTKCCYGGGYKPDSQEVLGIYSTIKKVNIAMEQEVKEHLEMCGSDKIDTVDSDGYFKITNFDSGENIVLRIFTQKVI